MNTLNLVERQWQELAINTKDCSVSADLDRSTQKHAFNMELAEHVEI